MAARVLRQRFFLWVAVTTENARIPNDTKKREMIQVSITT